jgi:hypothetical protein
MAIEPQAGRRLDSPQTTGLMPPGPPSMMRPAPRASPPPARLPAHRLEAGRQPLWRQQVGAVCDGQQHLERAAVAADDQVGHAVLVALAAFVEGGGRGGGMGPRGVGAHAL